MANNKSQSKDMMQATSKICHQYKFYATFLLLKSIIYALTLAQKQSYIRNVQREVNSLVNENALTQKKNTQLCLLVVKHFFHNSSNDMHQNDCTSKAKENLHMHECRCTSSAVLVVSKTNWSKKWSFDFTCMWTRLHGMKVRKQVNKKHTCTCTHPNSRMLITCPGCSKTMLSSTSVKAKHLKMSRSDVTSPRKTKTKVAFSRMCTYVTRHTGGSFVETCRTNSVIIHV